MDKNETGPDRKSPDSEANLLFLAGKEASLSVQEKKLSDLSPKHSEQDSLFLSLMKEQALNPRTPERLSSTHKSKDKTLLAELSIDGTDLKHKAEKSTGKSEGRSFESAKHATNRVLEELKRSDAYRSGTAALISIANQLADDAALSNMVTDKNGRITRDSVTGVLKAEKGAQLRAENSKMPGPHEVTGAQLESLDTVRTHMETASAVSRPGAEFAINASAISAFSTEKIAKTLIEKKVDINNLDEKTLIGIMAGVAADADSALDKMLGPSDKKPGAAPVVDPVPALEHHVPDGKPDSQAAVKTDDKSKEISGARPELAGKKDPEKLEFETLDKKSDVPPPRVDVPLLADSEFAETAKQVLKKIDRDGSGKVTKEELAKALEDPSITGKEAQALAAMYQNFGALNNIGNHRGWFETKSIAPADLDRYQELQAEQKQRVDDAYAMKTWAHKNLAKFDRDGGGSLGRDEIEKALQDPQTSAEDKKVLEMVKKHYSEMGRFYESGVNLQAFDDFAKNVYRDTDAAKLTTGVWASMYNVNKGQRADSSRDLFADKTDPLKSISPDAIKQGSIGDCYFLAALGALAKSNPQAIKDAIKDNGDGTYTVTFPGAKDEPITVKAPTESEQGVYNHGGPHGIWASVMEKAYGQYCQQHFWRRGPFNLGGGDTPTEGADGGGRPGNAMALLTGNSVDSDMLIMTSQATTARKLEAAFSSNPPKSVTAGIAGFSGLTEDKFYTRHAYSIVGFKPDGKGSGMVTIRNPWGGADGTPDGTITISLEKFMKNFSDVAYEQ